MKIAIVDDEQQVRETLKSYLQKFEQENGYNFKIIPFCSGNELLENYSNNFDIIFFDIDMPGLNGIDTAKKIRETDNNVIILFVTNIAQYAINGYEVAAVDYMLKPISYMDFSMKVARALRRINEYKKEQVLLNVADGARAVQIDKIVYIEILSHYLEVHCVEESIKVRGSMHSIEESLLKNNFYRIHKSYLVNLAYVKAVKSSMLIVGDASLPLGRKYKQNFMQEYMQYIKNSG